jgi:hypothetical protein
MDFYIREDQADISVTLDGSPLFGTWATISGGNSTSNDAKTRPGGMGKEVAVGGPPTRADLTVTTQLTDLIAPQHKRVEGRVGKGDVEVTVLWLDPNATAIGGAGFTRKGKLKEATLPNATNTDSPAVGMYTLVVSCDEAAA